MSGASQLYTIRQDTLIATTGDTDSKRMPTVFGAGIRQTGLDDYSELYQETSNMGNSRQEGWGVTGTKTLGRQHPNNWKK
jgi:hypothetical protein